MYSRPVIIPLILLIVGIILVESLIPPFVIGEHYSKHLNETKYCRYKIKKERKETKNWICYLAETEQWYDGTTWHKTDGEVLFYIPKDSNKVLEYGTIVESDANLYRIENYEGSDFDYQRFMQRKRIYHNVYARNYETIGKDKSFDIMAVAYRCKLALKERLFASGLPKDRAALAVSLLLGDKSDLDEDVKLSFSVAGLSHILCVSGLHIGLIIAMFDVLLKFLHLLGMWGFGLRRFLLIAISWIIAFIVGCTPSALRVALMLTLTLLTDLTSFRSERINLLIVTAFILLLCDPLLLFDLGFQLSFLAVLGIMVCMPKANDWIRTKFPSFLKPLGKTAATTLSAQLFVLPIIVCRFHTLPLLFLFANVIVVPFVGIILFSIICLLVFVNVPLLGDLTTAIVSGELWFLQQTAEITDSITRSIFGN